MRQSRARGRSASLALCLVVPALVCAWFGGPRQASGAKPSSSGSASGPTASASAPASGSAAVLPESARPSSALNATVSKIAEALRSQTSSTLVVCTTPKSDTSAPRANDLATRYAALLAGALGPAAKAGKSPSTVEAARAAAAALRSFVIVDLEILQGELRVHAELYPIPRNLWDRARNPTPGASAHAFATAKLDAELRTYLAPVPLVALRADKATLDESEVLALGCEDLDADGSLELLTVSRRNLTVGRVRSGKLQILRRTAWNDLSPISATPWREPIANVAFPAASFIDVGLTDRAKALRLDSSLQVLGVLDGMPLSMPVGAACARLQPGALLTQLVRCRFSDSAAPIKDPGFAFDSWASGRVVAQDGSVREVWAAREAVDSKLVLRDNAGRSAQLARVGAQVAISDLDTDGDPEVITTKDVLEEKDDALTIRTWHSSGAVRDRVGLPVPTGVSAVTTCPPDSPGLRATVIATRNELWVLR